LYAGKPFQSKKKPFVWKKTLSVKEAISMQGKPFQCKKGAICMKETISVKERRHLYARKPFVC
jgi:hypothetical protein